MTIASFKYTPDPVTIKAGGQLRWTNLDRAPHTATTDEGQTRDFDTGRLDLAESDTITPDQPGSYAYYCTFHRFMTGTVQVVD